jgi:hypothetical protein
LIHEHGELIHLPKRALIHEGGVDQPGARVVHPGNESVRATLPSFHKRSVAREPWPPAADAARKQAIETYLAYRRDGGENLSVAGRVFSFVSEAIATDQTPAVQSELAELSVQPDLPGYLRALLPKLQAVLRGSRDMHLADDPELHYDDAAELTLLLEHLGAPGS